MRLVHEGRKLLGRQLGGEIIVQREDPAGGAGLDDIRAVLDVQAHRLARLFRAMDDSLLRPGSSPMCRAGSLVVAVPPVARSLSARRACASGDEPAIDGVSQSHVDSILRADVADRRESGVERLPRVARGDQSLLRDRPPQAFVEVDEPALRSLARQVRVRIDEPRKKRRIAEVHDGNAGGNRQAGSGLLDFGALDQDDRVLDDSVRAAVEHAGGLERDHSGRGR